MAFATVKPSSLTPAAREVLARATSEWRRVPSACGGFLRELELFGLVETRTEWQWSTRHSGAGRHVVFWRLTPATTTSTA